MQTRSLGQSDVRLSEITLGTWGLAQESYGPVRRERFDETVRSALESGVTSFDVAPVWGDGEAERRVGQLIGEADAEATLITRGGARFVDGKLSHDFTLESLIEDCEASLERLGVDTIDVWLLHAPDETAIRESPWPEAVEKLEQQGKIRTWGMSVGTVDEARMAVAEGAPAICLPYNLLRPFDVEDLETELAAEGCSVLARSPLLYGMLGGRWSRHKRFSDKDHRAHRWGQRTFEERLRQIDQMRFLVGDEHPDLATAAIRFVLSHSSVASVLVGARTPYQITAAVDAAAEGPPYLSEDHLLRLGKIRGTWR